MILVEPNEHFARPSSMTSNTCPLKSQPRPFKTEDAALARLATIRSYPHTPVTPIRVFECRCGAYHLSKSLDEGIKR